ncbi:TerB family tellurite resistance protein [Flavitalea flava]
MRKYSITGRLFLSLFLSLALLLPAGSARSQTIADAITQLVYDFQKLTILKSTLKDMYTGYQIIDKGYTHIKNIAKGNFNLHKAFLDGLLAVSPTVKNYSRVVDIINTEYTIVNDCQTASRHFQGNKHFSLRELDYIHTTYSLLIKRSGRSLDELVRLLTDDELRMSDGERLRAIDRVYADINRQRNFLQEFTNDQALQAAQRAKEVQSIDLIRQLYGITN